MIKTKKSNMTKVINLKNDENHWWLAIGKYLGRLYSNGFISHSEHDAIVMGINLIDGNCPSEGVTYDIYEFVITYYEFDGQPFTRILQFVRAYEDRPFKMPTTDEMTVQKLQARICELKDTLDELRRDYSTAQETIASYEADY